jgi:hypothetical protein
MSGTPVHNDLGAVAKVRARPSQDQPDQIVLLAQTERGEHAFPITGSAAQKLWAHLTQILYPQAASNLTGRIETAATWKRVPSGITDNVKVTHREEEGMIEVGGLNRDGTWTMDFTVEMGHDLWVSLEDILHNVKQGREDSQTSSTSGSKNG